MNFHKIILAALFLLLLSACNIIKTMKVLKKGTVAQKHYKEEISFESRAGLIIVKVKVNGKDYNFIYDSGATNCVNKEVAEALKLKPFVNQTAEDSEGKKGAIKFALIDEIKLGNISFLNTGAAIIDLNAIPELACLHVDGLIGANLMRKAFWQIDYVKKTLTFASHIDSLRVPKNAFSISFVPLISSTPVVDIETNGIKSKGNVFDTGSSGEVTLSSATFKKVIKQDPRLKYVRGIGSSSAGLYGKGSDTNFIAKIAETKMGTLVLKNNPISFKRDKGNLGSNFFKDYVLTFDWKQNKIWFVQQPKEEMEWVSYGFSVAANNKKLTISYLIENSPAANAGIKLGDEVLSINGKDYSSPSTEDYCEIVVNEAPWKKNNKLQMVIRSGGIEKTIDLEKKVLLSN